MKELEGSHLAKEGTYLYWRSITTNGSGNTPISIILYNRMSREYRRNPLFQPFGNCQLHLLLDAVHVYHTPLLNLASGFPHPL